MIRAATPADAAAIAAIFNEGMGERVATFETREHGPADVERWIEGCAVVLVDERGGELTGFVKVGPYTDDHHYYAGVGEATLYVAGPARRAGIGSALLDAGATAAPAAGLHKLVAKIFTSNEASIALFGACGWRAVGTHLRHGQLDGEWKDVLVMEILLDH